jgi:ATP-binding cassette subfamily B protein
MFQIKWILQNLNGKRFLFFIALFLSVLTSSFAIVNPKISQIIVDTIIVGVKDSSGSVIHHTENLIPLLLLMIGVALLVSSLRYIMVIFFENSSQYLVIKLREKLYANLQKLDMRFYDKFRTGDLMTRLTGDLDMVRHFTAWIVFTIVDSIVLFVVTLVYFFTVSWQLTLALFATTPLIFIVAYIFSKKIRPVFINLREKLSQMNSTAQENISGNRVVKAFNRETYESEKFNTKNTEFHDSNLKASYTWLKFFPVLEFLAQSLTVTTIFVGGVLIMQNKLTFGQLTAFSALTWALANPMRLLGQILNDLQRFFASANKIIELFYAHTNIQNRPGAISGSEPLKGHIQFENVTFKHESQVVFDKISIDIKPGETIGIMGPTGSGKTTFVNLLARFYDITSGKILIDGIDVRDYDINKLRSSIGMATQDIFLFSDTIDGNIAYGNPNLPEEKVREYAEVADADGFIAKTTEGYDTIIGERGVGLSGGQKQRLALARALAVRAPIIVLDDTTSAVDMETEQLIQNNLSHLDYNCTKIIIAQRITSVRHASKIIILDDHKIVEQGTHEELLKLRGYYYEIFSLQQEITVIS